MNTSFFYGELYLIKEVKRMKLLISIITAFNLITNTSTLTEPNTTKFSNLIDVYILAYDTMLTGINEPILDYIILDMESIYFKDITYEDRQKAIQYFQKYNKPVLNASLFKLQQIGLADKLSNLKLKGTLLMMTNIEVSENNAMIIEGYRYHSPTGAARFRVTLKEKDDKWKVDKVDLVSVS